MFSQNQNGSTIIEVIIAMLILTLLTIGLNAGVVSIIKSNINSKELTSATSVGYQLFENFRRQDYITMRAIGSSTDTIRSRFVREWYMNSGDTTQTKIDLTVRWPISNQNHNISLSTIIARP